MKRVAVTVLSLALLAGPALAHHSGAMFDRSKVVELDGVVKEFGWNNPHSWIRLVANDATAGNLEWTVEMGSYNGLARAGWTKNTLKPGDHILLKVYPLKSGSPGGAFKEVTVAGKVMGGGPAGAG